MNQSRSLMAFSVFVFIKCEHIVTQANEKAALLFAVCTCFH